MNYCDDGGACHHNCADRSGKCYRRQCCEPLSNVFPNDEWPPPSGAEVHETDPTLSKPTPTPSITVGTQVRLTGVVEDVLLTADWPRVKVGLIGFRGAKTHVSLAPTQLEVIRQPFKRGEVVYYVGDKDSEPLTVVTDEVEGFVLLARHVHGTETLEWDATTFERRP